MISIYYLAAALLIYLSYKSFRGGVDYLNYFKQELSKPVSDFTPFATVIAPCKGLDEGLAENLNALLAQAYPSYEVLFVVDDANDPAVKIVEDVPRKAAQNAKMVIAPEAKHSSQKVENLREAVLHADSRSAVFVFVDSDAHPGKDWLGSLVAPLADENVGAATGYRWFVSEKSNLAGGLLSVWNASIASALGPNRKSNFCWGGSMAISRKTFEDLNIREKWKGTLSDDFAVTRAMNAAGKSIYFVPKALTLSIENATFGRLFEFTNRQMKITRVYAEKLWLLSFFGSGLFNLVLIWSALILTFQSFRTLAGIAAAVTLICVALLGIGKAWLRFRAARIVLGEQSPLFERQFAQQMILWVLTPTVFFINSTAALFSRRINWRGTVYEMISPTETRILRKG